MKTVVLLTVLNFAFFGLANNGEDEKTTSQINTTDEKGRKQGKWILLGKDKPELGYPSDGKISEGDYLNDRKNGTWIIYFKDGVTPKVIGEFVNNRPNGSFQKFYPNGNLKEESTFEDQRYVGVVKRYGVDGALIYQAIYNKAGLESGEVKYFYDNGKPMFFYTAENGSPIGEATRFWNNGEVKEKVKFNAEGKWLTSSGIIPQTKPLVNENKPEGKQAPMLDENVDSYKPNSYNIILNENKEVWMEGEFKNKILWDGKLYIYDSDGLLMKVEVYKEGDRKSVV